MSIVSSAGGHLQFDLSCGDLSGGASIWDYQMAYGETHSDWRDEMVADAMQAAGQHHWLLIFLADDVQGQWPQFAAALRKAVGS